MDRQSVAEKYLTKRQYEIWNRTEIKKSHEYKKIAEDFWVTKQRAFKEYTDANLKVNTLFDNLYKDENI